MSLPYLPWYSQLSTLKRDSVQAKKDLMAKTRSMTRNHTSLSSSRKSCKTSDKGDEGPWSDLNPDVLLLVIMQLGVIDFLAFGGVCKSWRSVALSNRTMFMASRPPLEMDINRRGEDSSCLLEDHEGRRFTTIIPHSARRRCWGITCGYLIFFTRGTRDFWLVHPITRHELHFPDFPRDRVDCSMKSILVFSPLISAWVFAVFHRKIPTRIRPIRDRKISFAIAGKRRWNHVSSPIPIHDLHAFKGKIYTLHTDFSVGELVLDLKRNREHKWTLFENRNFPKPDFLYPILVSSGENLFIINQSFIVDGVLELDFGEMRWVLPEKTTKDLAFFLSHIYPSAAIKPKSWVGTQTPYKTYNYFLDIGESQDRLFYYSFMWYFPHDCLNVNLLDE